MLKKYFLSTLVAFMLIMAGVPVGVGSATGSSDLEIQCVSDQLVGVPGGKVGYHILYHNVQNKTMSKAWLKVKVPKGFDLDIAEGADWDEISGTLKWNLKDIDSAYNDVPADHWAIGYIQKVTASGYMNGSGDGSFRPDQPISRAEFIVVMLRVRGVKPVAINSFSDSNEHWAKKEIGTSKALKYIDGQYKDKFNPDGYMNRDEVAKLLVIMLYRGELKDGETAVIQHWPDVPKDLWSFGWIEELSLIAHESKHDGPFSEKLVRYLPDQTKPL
jgi:hypothetical protein